MPTSKTPTADAVVAKYLNEVYGKEKQLETALTAQIALVERPQLKKALQEHLKVTKRQSRDIERRIKKLGTKAEVGPHLPGPAVVSDAASTATAVVNRAVAAAKGPVQALRGTGLADRDLRTVRDCLWNEAEEIAHYDVIEQVASGLGDTDTAKLARTHRREEEQMQRLLQRQLAPLAKAVIHDEVPKDERPAPKKARSTKRRRVAVAA